MAKSATIINPTTVDLLIVEVDIESDLNRISSLSHTNTHNKPLCINILSLNAKYESIPKFLVHIKEQQLHC